MTNAGKMFQKFIICFLAITLLAGVTGCGSANPEEIQKHAVYYLANSETKVEVHEYVLQGTTTEDQVKELLLALQTNPASLKFKAPLALGFQVLDYTLESGKLVLNVSKEYMDLSITQEVLVRAAVVKTLTGLSQVNFVSFAVEGEPLRDALGKSVGWMSQDEFIENEGNEINTYEEASITLYFADEKGSGLMETTRTIEYSTNISLEKMIVEELIKGPNADKIYATINPQTRVASVVVQDGVCYVNLDEGFLTQVPNVTAEVTIYSIVNSLVELNHINKVQIAINGDSAITYREKFSLDTYFERNLDIVVTK